MGNCKSLVIIPRGMTMMFFVSIQWFKASVQYSHSEWAEMDTGDL
jgi:hypothetical protein